MALEPTQKRMILAIVLGTMTVSSYLLAQGTTQLVASALLDGPPSASSGGRRARNTAAEPRNRDPLAQAILTRNIFDRGTGPISWDPPVAEEAPPPDVVVAELPPPVDPNAPPPPCEGSIRLVASYVRANSPDQSFAAITNATGSSLLYARGMSVDDREVVEILRSRVILRPTGGALCSLSMFAEEPPPVAMAAPAPAVVAAAEPAPASSGDGLEASELDANIQQISETSYAINRSLVDRLLANQAELMRTARVIPHEVDGRTVGVKIYGIRRSSVLGRLGIQNGDMLRNINGFDLTEPNRVLEAYTSLRSAERLTLNVERRGAPVTMDYQIR